MSAKTDRTTARQTVDLDSFFISPRNSTTENTQFAGSEIEVNKNVEPIHFEQFITIMRCVS